MKKRIMLFAGTILMTFSIASFDVLAENLEDDYAGEACIIDEESSDDGNESYGSQDISLQTEMEEDCTEMELQIESVTVEDDPGLTVVDMDEEGISAISDDTDSIWETVMPSTITTVNGVYYYEISSAEELAYIAETGGDWLGYNYILKNDIILNNVTLETDSDGNLLTDTSTLKEWTPISDFSGVFDGNGYSISGVYEDRDADAGFFVYCTGNIYNLSIKNSYIKGTYSVGGICSDFSGSLSYMSNCSFDGTVVGSTYVGGLIGQNWTNYITDCTNYGNVWAISNDEYIELGICGDYVAGIVGYSLALEISNCTNWGNINSVGNTVGGIAGGNDINLIENCVNYGSVTGNERVAGICGFISFARLVDCSNIGDIKGNKYVGGLSGYTTYLTSTSLQSNVAEGYNLGSISGESYVGGIFGYMEYSYVSNCYSAGTVFGESYTGALIGSSQSVWGHGTVSNCYYLIDGNESYPGFGNVSEDIDDVVEGKYTAFFPILISSEADASYSALGYRIEECSLELSQMSYTYDGTEKEPGVAVMKDSSELIEGTDYTVAYSSNINVGNAVVTVTGIGDYKGSLEKTYTISKASQTVTASAAASSIVAGNTTTVTASGQGTITYSSSNTSVATVNSSGVVTGLKPGTVTITATAAGTNAYNSASNTVNITVTLGSGVISSLTNTSKGITVKWSKVTGAMGYTVYRKTSSAKKYTKVKTVTSGSTVSYTDTAVKSKNGTTYLYKVVPYYGSTVSSGTAKTTVRLTGATLSSAKNTSSKKAIVKWKKTSKVSGYQIQYSMSKTFASGNKTTKVSGVSKTSKTLTGLKKGKTYYVRVRTYKTVNGKTYYSAWSSKKSVKIKK